MMLQDWMTLFYTSFNEKSLGAWHHKYEINSNVSETKAIHLNNKATKDTLVILIHMFSS
jgi:hypothetical protein